MTADALLPSAVSVAILVVSYNGATDLRECLRSILDSDDGPIQKHIVVVDNASMDGTPRVLACDFPGVDLIAAPKNLGFAEGNNLGWRHIEAHYPNLDYLMLLNQDTLVASGWLTPLVAHLQGHPVSAAAQPKIRLHPETEKLNTSGNVSHFLGFGFTSGYGQIDQGQFDAVRTIDFPSGAAVMLRAAAIRKTGLFEPEFFAYLEDADLGWKLRQLGYRIDMVPASLVWHKYRFNEDYRYYFYLERNRWMMLATYYKGATLLLLLPALLIMEAGQFYFSARHGVLKSKFRAAGFFLNRRNLAALCQRRASAQHRRLIDDAAFMRPFIARVEFVELRSRLLRWIANPILAAYWAVARRLIVW